MIATRRGSQSGQGLPASSPPARPATTPQKRRWRPQFGLWGLLATMGLLCVPFAVWGGLLREGAEPDNNPKLLFFVMMAVASPMLVMILVSLFHPARRLWRSWRKNKTEDEVSNPDNEFR